MVDAIREHRVLLAYVSLISAALLLLTVMAIPYVLVSLPHDYFIHRSRNAPRFRFLRSVRALLKNLLGWLLIVAGVAMLLLPGQGVLTIVIGIALVDFPGKRKAQTWILTKTRVWPTMNWIRKKFGQPPFSGHGHYSENSG